MKKQLIFLNFLLCFLFFTKTSIQAQIDQSFAGTTVFHESIRDVVQLQDGSIICAGQIFQNPNGTLSDPFIFRKSATGTIIWSRTLASANGTNGVFTNVMIANNGEIIAAGYIDQISGFAGAAGLIARYDINGNPLWENRYNETPASNNGEVFFDIVEDPATGILYACGSEDWAPSFSNSLVVSVDAGGNLLWQNIYNIPDNQGGVSDQFSTMALHNGNLYVFGLYQGNTFYDLTAVC